MNPTVIRRADSQEGHSELMLLMASGSSETQYKIVEIDPGGFQYVRFAWFGEPERSNEEFSKILGRESKWKEVEQKSPVVR